MALTPLTADQVLDWQENVLRDKFYPAPDIRVGLSPYNRKQKADFFTPAQVERLHVSVELNRATALEQVRAETYDIAIEAGESASDATTISAAARQDALYRYMRVEAHELMAMDAGMMASFVVGSDTSVVNTVLEQWKTQDANDIAGISGSSGSGITIEAERE